MFPTLSEAITGQRITVAAPFFNQWMVPIGLVDAAADRHRSAAGVAQVDARQPREQFLVPDGLRARAAAGRSSLLASAIWSSGLCFAFAGFVMGTIVQEFWRGARVRQQTSGTDMFTALVGLVGRNKRRYGGYLVHVGVVLMFLGFAGEGFKKQETLLLKPGQAGAGRRLRHSPSTASASPTTAGKQMVTAQITVLRDGGELTKMYPARWFFRKHEDRADDGSRDPPHARRRPVHRDAAVRGGGSSRRTSRSR